MRAFCFPPFTRVKKGAKRRKRTRRIAHCISTAIKEEILKTLSRSAVLGLGPLALGLLTAAEDASSQAQEPNRAPFGLESPYVPRAARYYGQTHVHTDRSDGRQSPTAVAKAYRAAGYDFLSVSDHRMVTTVPAVPGLLLIPGSEDNEERYPGAYSDRHINRTGATSKLPSPHSLQDIVDFGRAEGSFVTINHPNWPGKWPRSPGWTDADLIAVKGYDAIEIWSAAIGAGSEARADFLLTSGRRVSLIASDDCHDVRRPSCFTTGVAVFADSLSESDIVGSLKSGNYYSSAGGRIDSIRTDGLTVSVSVPVPSKIEFIVRGGTVASAFPDALKAAYEAAPSDVYVRIRITNSSTGKKAWSNPVHVTRKGQN
jgi:hypothetical protein